MRYDESVTFVHYASRPWYIALTNYTAPNNHVFHSLLVHASTWIFGGAPWAIRLPALIAGILLVPASYVAARALVREARGALAASLVAGSSMLVEYSTNARGYTILALVFVLLLALATHLPRAGIPPSGLPSRSSGRSASSRCPSCCTPSAPSSLARALARGWAIGA